MCGRYSLFTGTDELEDRFDAGFRAHEPTYNCAPSEELPVITSENPDEARRLDWGLTPSWADERKGFINARAETVRDRPSFESAFESRRCLVPADGFYEWVDRDGTSQPHRVAFADDRPFAMAGLYERWRPPTTQTGLGDFGGGTGIEEEAVESFTILTTEPNDLVEDFHHRMAVVLEPETEETWLQGTPEEAAALLQPHPATEMTAYSVSTKVNAPDNDGPELIEPV